MSHDDHAPEPIRGLPELPPEGEHILWQGAPLWGALARRAFHVRKVMVYLGIFLAARGSYSLMQGASIPEALGSIALVFTLSVTAVALLYLLAWLMARATVYTITNRRIVIRFGVAIQLSVNLPYRVIQSASLKAYSDGTGDISLVLEPSERVSYLIMWPHVRPWRLLTPQPMMRCIPDAKRVAELLGKAIHGEYVPADPTARPELTGMLSGSARSTVTNQTSNQTAS
ncbi:photosynthetic complex putative assembly protein PuhB [Ectothiorhodospira lacustris]|uniref:photosynthetic complex putative assembly protein PuhB n=1 Tax=Ectothiorhodospira lacustris TaxID=2899127 RepID=UPI001EE84A9F|nr:PH domain-containing protein [Ectothiorhodospira lacustris]MCG5509286.1 PH domain-containing protein [Ectothiorhodospira lacustris]MCG5521340.1 PH domain-containing protein [Ectothiorhodospira lacustris]